MEHTAGVSNALLPQMQRDGIEVPRELSGKPELQRNLLGYLEAFYDLDTERHHGNGLMRIPWSSIVQYAEFYGMDVYETVYFVRHMDDAHISHLAKAKGNNNGTGASGTREIVQRPPRPD